MMVLTELLQRLLLAQSPPEPQVQAPRLQTAAPALRQRLTSVFLEAPPALPEQLVLREQPALPVLQAQMELTALMVLLPLLLLVQSRPEQLALVQPLRIAEPVLQQRLIL